MSGWLDDLRTEYRAHALARIAAMHSLLDRLSRNAADLDALSELDRHFHSFAGMGATYGFPGASRIGQKGEATTTPLVQQGQAPAAPQLRLWRALVADLPRALTVSSQDSPGHPS